MKEFVVYTVLVGGYDDVLQPKVVDDRFDYILFSNDFKETKQGVWSVREIPRVVENDNKRLSRYPKTHPETLLSDYKASLYIDANIQIQDQWVYDRFVELYEQNIEYSGIKLVLTGRDCIYEHSFDMCQVLVEHDYVAIKQCHLLHELGFPRHFGLNENNIIFRIHTERMKTTDEEWWNWVLHHSSRDQFSYMYCLWKHKVEVNYFLPVGEDSRTSTHFCLIDHNNRQDVLRSKAVKRSLFERLRTKSKSFELDKHRQRWTKLCESSHPVLMLYVDGIFTIFTNLPRLAKSFINKTRKLPY